MEVENEHEVSCRTNSDRQSFKIAYGMGQQIHNPRPHKGVLISSGYNVVSHSHYLYAQMREPKNKETHVGEVAALAVAAHVRSLANTLVALLHVRRVAAEATWVGGLAL